MTSKHKRLEEANGWKITISRGIGDSLFYWALRTYSTIF